MVGSDGLDSLGERAPRPFGYLQKVILGQAASDVLPVMGLDGAVSSCVGCCLFQGQRGVPPRGKAARMAATTCSPVKDGGGLLILNRAVVLLGWEPLLEEVNGLAHRNS